jgi:oxygen-independent coproporphyrinogen-3 oxidase
LYVHVPFCSHACDFCAFYQVEPRRDDIERYLETIEREFALIGGERGFRTAFWGGGTPGLLPAADLERLGRAQIERCGGDLQEWTVELAPSSVRTDKLRVLRDLGVTRVSLGVQSLDATTLEALGRRHSTKQIAAAWDAIGAAGFPSRNLDLIFGAPGQTLDGWLADIDAAVAMQPDHVSTYCLTFEEDTALFVRLSQGKVSIDPERERLFYEAGWDRLGASGFSQYEVSNFCRPGHACSHNVNTWRMGEWWGAGPSAASQSEGVRGGNAADLDRWCASIADGRRVTEDRTVLTSAQFVEDALVFGLRMNEGVDLEALERRFGAAALVPFRPVLDECVANGLAVVEPRENYRLTREGMLVVDAVGAELLGLAEAEAS